MSPASHMIGRLRKLYGIVVGRMEMLHARAMRSRTGSARSARHTTMEQIETRVLLSSDTLGDAFIFNAGGCDTWQVISAGTNADAPAAQEAGHVAYDTSVGPVANFQWGTIAGPQELDTPFDVTLTAKDANGNIATDFNGTVNLGGMLAPGDITVGTETNTWSRPLYTSYQDSRTQVIYLAEEIGAAGQITSLALDVVTVPGQTLTNWTIRLKQTSLSTYSTNAWEGSGWTTVYQADQTISSTGWVTFTFSTPFQYDGTSNLMVDYSFNGTTTATWGTVRTTFADDIRTVYGHSNSVSGDPLTWSGTSPFALNTSMVPNVRLHVDRPATVTPAVSGNFVNGVWTGQVAVHEAAAGVYLTASDASGHSGASNAFETYSGQVTSLQWDTVSSPHPVDTPFDVTVTAKDIKGNTANEFNGTVNLSGLTGPGLVNVGRATSTFNYLLNSSYHDSRLQAIYLASEIGGAGPITSLALDITTIPGQVLNNWTIRVKTTPLSSYSSRIWESSEWTTVYQANQMISSTGWATFTFSTPFQYDGISNLMVDFSFNNSSASSSGAVRYTLTSPYRSIYGYSNSASGDPLAWSGTSSPSPTSTSRLPDIRLNVGTPVTLTPSVSGNFINGVWTGQVAVHEGATGVRLTASDGAGHKATSNAINTYPGPAANFQWQEITNPAAIDTPFDVTLTATDENGFTATGFNGTVNLSGMTGPGLVTVGTGASIWSNPLYSSYHDARTQVIYLASEVGGGGKITSLALNLATAPSLVLNNWTIRMKHTSLSSYSTNDWESGGWTTVYQANEAITSTGWVTFTFSAPFAYDGTSNLMVDFSFNNSSSGSYGTVRATPTSQERSIYYYGNGSYGDPLTWSGSVYAYTESVVPDVRLNIGTPVTVTPSVSGNFVNGVWTGQVSVHEGKSGVRLTASDASGHKGTSNIFTTYPSSVATYQWETIATQGVDSPFYVALTAKDENGYTATGFNGTVNLGGVGGPGLVTVGTGTSSWDEPLHTGYHDARTQAIYLASEIGGSGRISSLALDVTTLPGQMLKNWTIRLKHTSLSSYSSYSWESSGWTTVYQSDVTISSTGWVTFVFSTPFDYDGTSNLMVDLSFNNSSYSSNGATRSTIASQTRSLYAYDDSFFADPLTWSSTSWPSPSSSVNVPNIRLNVGQVLAVSPAVSGNFVNGVWSGLVTLHDGLNGVRLTASDEEGHGGTSNAFNLSPGPVADFQWQPITGTQGVDAPFTVALTARDGNGNLASTFNGTVNLSARTGPGLVTIGTGTSTWGQPLYASSDDSRTQSIYLASEIGGAGPITSLSLNVAGVPGGVLNNWTIRLKHTALSYYSSSSWEGSGWSTVYQSSQTISSTGWVTFTFSTPFEYDGTSNLMVDLSFNNSSRTSSGSVKYTTTSQARSLYSTANSSYGDPLTWTGNNYPSPMSALIIPNIRLNVGQVVAVSPAVSGNFVNGVWTGQVAVSDGVAGVVLTAADASGHKGSSNAFNMTPGKATELVIGPIPSQQTVGIPFPVTITAKDTDGLTSTSFPGPVNLWNVTPGTVTIGTGSSTRSMPVSTGTHDKRQQVIYLASEIGGIGPITSLALNINAIPGRSLNNWTIRMKPTALSSYSASGFESSGWTTVYQANQTISSTGWVTFTFNTPFNYDGTSNLMVDFSFNNSLSYGAGSIMSTYTSNSRELYYETNSSYGDPLTWSGTGSPNAYAGYYIPNIRLGMGVATPATAGPCSFADGVWTGMVTLGQESTGTYLYATHAQLPPDKSNQFNVSYLGNLAVTLPVSAREGDAAPAQGTVTIPQPTTWDVVVNLSSGDTSELTVQPTVTIPAGLTWASFDLTAVDDSDLDFTQQAAILASTTSYRAALATMSINDNETAVLTVTLPASHTESWWISGGGTVSISMPPTSNLTVKLSSSDTSELTVPASVTIPAGQTSAHFDLTIVDDSNIDGTQSAQVTASAQSCTPGLATMDVLDGGSELNITVSLPFTLYESQGLQSAAGTVSITEPAPHDYVVSLVSSDTTELTVPATVTILAGQTSATFDFTLIDDTDQDGRQYVIVTATAAGLNDDTEGIYVTDDEVHHFIISTITGPQCQNVPLSVEIRATDINGWPIQLYGGAVNLSASGEDGAIAVTPSSTAQFYYGGWMENVTFGGTGNNVVLSVDDGLGHTGTSNAFDVVTPGSITGTKWNDADGDGTRDEGEAAMAGWTIYLDQNRNGVLDANERSTITSADGSYTFGDLPPGAYYVSEITQNGWIQSSPATSARGQAFALGVTGSTVTAYEIDPATGDVLRSFPAGTTTDANHLGLALGDGELFVVDGAPNWAELREYNAATGVLIHSISLTNWDHPDGAAWLNGMLYSLCSGNSRIREYDPQTSQNTRAFDIYGYALDGVLAGAGDRGTLFATSSASYVILEINLATGSIIRTIPTPQLLTSPADSLMGMAYLDGIVLCSRSDGTVFRFDAATGAFLGTFAALGTGPYVAMDGKDSGFQGRTVQLALGQNIDGQDLGGYLPPPAEIHGTKWNDLNHNGVREEGEPALAGWTVYLDLNRSGDLDAGDISTTTGADGSYSFLGLPQGTYYVNEVAQPGWYTTTPATSASGMLFALGVSSSSGGVATAYSIDTATGAVLGSFPVGWGSDSGFMGMAVGQGRLFVAEGYYGYTVIREYDAASGGLVDSDVLSDVGYISGVAWLNGSVYLLCGYNYNNTIWEWNPNTDSVTRQFHTNSSIVVGGLAGGGERGTLFASTSYGNVYEIDPANGTIAHSLQGANYPMGLAYVDGMLLTADYNTPWLLRRTSVETGQSASDLHLAVTGYVYGLAGDGDDFTGIAVTLVSGQVAQEQDFGAWLPPPCEIHGTQWNDLDRDGTRDEGEPAQAGWTVYLDQNRNGIWDAGETSTVTDANGQYAFTDLPVGKYYVNQVMPAYWLATLPVAPSGGRLFTTGGNWSTTVYTLDPLTGSVMGSFQLASPPAGSYWALAVGQGNLFAINNATSAYTIIGQYDALTGEPIDSDPLSVSYVDAAAWLGGKVYLQSDYDSTIKVWDPVTDTIVRTIPAGSIRYGLAGAGDRGTLFGASSNTVYEINPDTGEVIRSSSISTLLYSGSNITSLAYVDGVLLVSTYYGTVYRVDPDTWAILGSFTSSIGALGGDGDVFRGYAVDLALGQSAQGKDFAGHLPQGEISGVKWHDLNGDGTRDASEPPMAGWTIFLDSNRNGALDAGEISMVTGPDGRYSFTGLLPGEYTVTQLPQALWVATQPGQRLFSLASSGIVELDPATGAVIHTLPTQWLSPQGYYFDEPMSLAYGQGRLFVSSPIRVIELDPDTGAVLDMDALELQYPGYYSVGYVSSTFLNGKLYCSFFDYMMYGMGISVWDPVADELLEPLNTSSTMSILGLAAASDRNILYASIYGSGPLGYGAMTIVSIDPATGAIVNSVPTNAPATPGRCLTYLNGELWVARGYNEAYRIDPDTGAVLGTVTIGAQDGYYYYNEFASEDAGGVVFVDLGPDEIRADVDFGDAQVSVAPAAPDLLASADSGSSSTDNLTNHNNAGPDSRLAFELSGLVTGAQFSVYANGTLLVTGIATAASMVVQTDAGAAIPDGHVSFYVSQREVDKLVSRASAPLEITIDTVSPVAPGLVDTSFGQQGSVLSDFGYSSDASYAVVRQADGKMLMAGYFSGLNYNGNSAVLRVNADGSLDTSFGQQGILRNLLGPGSQSLDKMAIQVDGKILVLGTVVDYTDSILGLARLNPDGTPDTTFAQQGVLLLNVDTYLDPDDIALQDDGKIVVVGRSSLGATVIRLTSDGALDESFGGDGIAAAMADEYGALNAVVVAPDGKLVVTGNARAGNSYDVLVMRFGSDGVLDPSFGGGDGIVTTAVGTSTDYGSSVALQADGKIVIAGRAFYSSGGYFAVLRYNADGTLDADFSGDGMVTASFGGSGDGANAVAILEDGRIVAGGSGADDWAVISLMPNGEFDTSFSTDGMARVDFAGKPDTAYGMCIAPDGKIILTGSARLRTDTDFGIARLNSDGTMDSTFDGDGLAALSLTGTNSASAMLKQPDGKVVVVGTAAPCCIALARYYPDGRLDDSFGVGGVAVADLGDVASQTSFSLTSCSLQADGSIVVGGTIANDFMLARFGPDGSLDQTFGTGGRVTTSFGDGEEHLTGVSVLSGGKILASGYGYSSSNYSYDYMVARYNADGSLDNSFGLGGKMTTDVGRVTEYAYGLTVLPDGRFVLAGSSGGYLCLAAFSANGTLDTSFGVGGKSIISGSSGTLYAVTLDRVGRIVAAGSVGDAMAIARFDTNGLPDATFGLGGVSVVGTDGARRARSVAVLPDGRIVAAGYSWNALDEDMAIVCVQENGAPATDFNVDGVAWFDFGSGNDVANAVLVTEGRIIIAGRAPGQENDDFALVGLHIEAQPPVDLDSASDTGPSDTDNITSLATLTVNVPAGHNLRFYWDGVLVSGDCDAGGEFTLSGQADGVHTGYLTTADDAGNESHPSVGLRVTVETGQGYLGDANGDGVVNAADIDMLYATIRAGSGNARCDMTNDGLVDQADVDELVLNILGTQYGDANLDSMVNNDDGSILMTNWQGTRKGWAQGDFNGDGVVSLADGSLLLTNWQWHGVPTVTVVATDPSASETPGNGGTFTISRPSTVLAMQSPLTVHYTIDADTTDCASLGTSVVIPAGLSSTTVTVLPVDDSEVEADETVILTLDANPAYTVGAASNATVTIADNDIAGDGFESGDGIGGQGWTGDWVVRDNVSITSSTAWEGTYSLALPGNVGAAFRSFDLSGVTAAHLTFQWKADSLEAADAVWIDAFNGTTWARVMTVADGQDDNQWHWADIDLSGYSSSNCMIRFCSLMTDLEDFFYVDDLRITA